MSTRIETPQAMPASAPSVPDTGIRANRSGRFQPEIQGLRALAVLLVVMYHFWPDHLSGGYIGVDVFFVISGYLITAHLFKEANRTGRIRLGQFWARRIRRLLPLSLLVLGLTAVAAVMVLPSTEWQGTRRQVMASALYVQNWILAGDAIDYSKADEQATAVQHFWSLSVEEQFYVLWPVLLAVALAAALSAHRRRGRIGASVEPRVRVRAIFLWVIGVLGVASLGFSIYYTANSAAQAYFVTPTRIWEFALGAVLALLLGDSQFSGRWGNVLGWVGFAMILGSAYLYSDLTPFPGWTALVPTVGATLLMACGGKGPGTGIHWWLSQRPATAIGDWSYAIYLWHWPVVIFSPYISDAARDWYIKVLLILGVVLLSALTTRFFETPIRRAKILAPTWRTMVAAATGMALVVGVAYYSVEYAEQEFVASDLSEDHPCYGYRALANPDQCGDPFEGTQGLMPSAADVSAQSQNLPYPDCQAEAEDEEVGECWLGADQAQADGTIAVFGDSHATMWLTAFDEIAQDNGKRLLVMTRSGCTPHASTSEDSEDLCGEANLEILERVAEDDDIETVIIAGSQKIGGLSAPEIEVDLPESDLELDDTARSMLTPIQFWLEAEKEVVVLGETPRLNEESNEEETLPECVALNEDDLSACNDDLEDTRVGPRWLTESAEVFEGAEDYHFVPTEDLLCEEDTCYAVLGGAITYRDNSHVSLNFVRSVTPELEDRMEDAILN
ncbi:acyltransferase family protein [Nesterenkonia lutea]|uniref:Peptidoglycan/LPS O-acetylase OafA/YrhL n=1 Tax=Nesterenkonia lutea TaxID=272919 RepID=A0ABR9JD64_9MICC|nr:acyltransferase family protein [Nesterenkonia lutea]MBE1523725.1 peptidoglycan/LPS O-acetylase OafA/YrhL [Nesterenkonia lutea]